MIEFKEYEIWFVTGSQHLYGNDILKQVLAHSQNIASALSQDETIPISIVFKALLTTPEEISKLCIEANSDQRCIGLICWMHTFSPGKMWINGLRILQKPMLHLHTQYNIDIPWSEIDMDFMNLNQSAHGGREFGHINSRMRLDRKVVVGHWQDTGVREKIAIWARVAGAWTDSQSMKIARFGDNMREVAVTEGDKVAAQIQFGYSVNGYGLGDLSQRIEAVSDKDIDLTVDSYFEEYAVMESLYKSGDKHNSLREAARIEIGMRTFLVEGGFSGFTTTFENLTGLTQLPGIAVQRLMAEGYGFGAEGDWKTAALVRSMKVMAHELEGGNSFMEDYTYHFNPQKMAVLGAHMLEICPSIASRKPSCEIHPLGIGGKSDPVRLVFQSGVGSALNASVVDMGNRFRLLINTVDAVAPKAELPRLPVASVLWQVQPDLKTGAAAWILAGGAHHTCYSQNLSTEYLEDFAEMAGIEYILIDKQTSIPQFKKELRWNELYYHLNKGIR
ncbi:MAG: L-arabinose isomerase [Saprospiraceae bacterium]|jgi:L-arabinose isomerase